MELRELGKTAIQLPIVGFGTWQYQGGVEPLQTGVAMGACLIDTAESYGTEDVVGQAIQAVRKNIFLATKISPRHFRYSDVIESANRSLKRLRTDYVDLYQLHWPNYTIPIHETMGAMEALVESGKARYIGVSNFMLRDLKSAQQAMSKHRIVSNQLRYNLVDRTIENGLLRYCQEEHITVIAYSPLATGLSGIHARDPDKVLRKVVRSTSRTVAQIALNWCFSQYGVVTIPKADSVDHVRENCAASDFQLSAEEVQLLNTSIKFRQRGRVEIALRRLARHMLQTIGKNQ